MGLFDDIKKKTMQRQQNMLGYFQKQSGAVVFNEVNVEKLKGTKSDLEKGVIKPPINYIDDEDNDAQSG